MPVVVGQDLAGREHEVVADGGVGVSVILRSRAVLTHQAEKIRHGGTRDGAVVRVLFNHDRHVAKPSGSDTRRRGANREHSGVAGHTASRVANDHGEMRAVIRTRRCRG